MGVAEPEIRTPSPKLAGAQVTVNSVGDSHGVNLDGHLSQLYDAEGHLGLPSWALPKLNDNVTNSDW